VRSSEVFAAVIMQNVKLCSIKTIRLEDADFSQDLIETGVNMSVPTKANLAERSQNFLSLQGQHNKVRLFIPNISQRVRFW
jgi:hypothetical protein